MITIKITSWERERRPHSYWYKPQPRGRTTPASWREEATSMEMNPGALPHPGRVPAQEFWSPKTWWRWRRRSELILEKRVLSSRVLGRERYIGEGGQPEVDQGPQAPPWRGLGGGRARWPPRPPLAPLWPHFGSS